MRRPPGWRTGRPVRRSTRASSGSGRFAGAVELVHRIERLLPLGIKTIQLRVKDRTPAELAQVVTCIEATIAFRKPDAEQELFNRLAQADREHALGLGEAGVVPASIKTVAEWFLRKVHPLLSKPELDYIKSDPQEAVPKVRWARLFLTGKPGPSQPALAARS